MKPDTKVWHDQSQEHLKDAEFCLQGTRYGLSLYCYHQALEKILKAAIVEIADKIPPKSHQLDFLLTETTIPVDNQQWFEELAKITQHFWRVRYPDIRMTKAYASKAKIALIVKSFAEVYLWIKSKLESI